MAKCEKKSILAMVDFDSIDDWEAKLSTALRPYLPEHFALTVVAAAPEYIEDAREIIFDLGNRDVIIDAALTWIRSIEVAGYHGSRLTDEEIASVRANGLVPLKAEARRPRLIRALSSHPNWHNLAGQLDATIYDHGPRGVAGRREGQVHLTLSKAGLIRGFNHYLTHGAEFDQQVAQTLLGAEGKQLLARDGHSVVIKVCVPGPVALDAAHPHFGVDDLRAKGDVPNLVNEFLEAWSYRQAHPGFQSDTLRVDCGMVFRSIVPAAWIREFDIVQ
jgi:hypothetical protein